MSGTVSVGGLDALATEFPSLVRQLEQAREKAEKELEPLKSNPDQAWPAVWRLLSDTQAMTTAASGLLTRTKGAIDSETADVYPRDLQVAAVVDLYSLFFNHIVPALVSAFSKVLVALGQDEPTINMLSRDKLKWLTIRDITGEVAAGIRPDNFGSKPVPGTSAWAPLRWEGRVSERYRHEHVPQQALAAAHVAEIARSVPPSIESVMFGVQGFYIAFMLFCLRALAEVLKYAGSLLTYLSGLAKAARAYIQAVEEGKKATTPEEKRSVRQRLQEMAKQIRDAVVEIFRAIRTFIATRLKRLWWILTGILYLIQYTLGNLGRILGKLKDYWLLYGGATGSAMGYVYAKDRINEQAGVLQRLASRPTPARGGDWPTPRALGGGRFPTYNAVPQPGGSTKYSVDVDGRTFQIPETP
ncbi:hypothetical protein [Phytohabitans suffuscus]|uniref:Uncharacterized protein n=1 Tax=Phytohabitans suffuscus TaxID=624315 RepID=A0A6F8YQD1_9ACTN|nr:hypothetical protein [Phytohabitans suffuscus]BCB88312.1 hypothetical protein Psuf_056250 [Phytohabitans suffuscus]